MSKIGVELRNVIAPLNFVILRQAFAPRQCQEFVMAILLNKISDLLQRIWDHKATVCLAGCLLFVGLAFAPAWFAGGAPPVVDAEGKIKAEGKMNHHEHDEHGSSYLEIKMLAAGDGGLWLGSKEGLYWVPAGSTPRGEPALRSEIRAMTQSEVGWLAAGKTGLHRLRDGEWQLLYEGDLHAVTMAGDIIWIGGKKVGVLESRDGGATWQKAPGFESVAENPSEKSKPRLIKDQIES